MSSAVGPADQTESPARPWEVLGPTWIEIDLDILARNLREIAAFVRRPLPDGANSEVAAGRFGLRPPSGPPRLLVVVKGDGYGHGGLQAARTAVESGADMLGVASLLEGLELRQAGIGTPILIFNPMTAAEAPAIARAALTPTISSHDAAFALAREAGAGAAGARGGFPFHLAVDTGMSRYGLAPGDLPDFAAAVEALSGLVLEGVYTHFSAGAARDQASITRMRGQLEVFLRALAALERRGLAPSLRHAACSAAVISLPEAYLDLVRVGNLYYGFFPGGSPSGGRRRPGGGSGDDLYGGTGGDLYGGTAGDLGAGLVGGFPAVQEAFTMVTRVLETREVPAGTGVGYGPDVRVRRLSRLATVPVGYADGLGVDLRAASGRPRDRFARLVKRLLRHLDRIGLLAGPLARLRRQAWSRAEIFHQGRPVAIVGRISMQQTIIDVTRRPEIQVGSRLTVHVRRALANPRLPRVYHQGGDAVAARTPSGVAEAAAGWDPGGSPE